MEEIKTDTYIRLYRKFTKWEWYDDANTMRVFLHCLLNANYTDKKWRGILVKRGSFLTGRRKLAVSLNLTEMQIRTALNKLKSTNEITIKTTSEYSIITINNWDSYQSNNQPLNQRVTNEQPTNNQRITTTNKDNKENKDNKVVVVEDIDIEKTTTTATEFLKNWYGSEFKNVYLTEHDHQKLLGMTMSEKLLDELIENLSQKIAEGKEKNWSQETPSIHYARLKAYWDYRRKNPDKFREKPSEPHESIYSNEIED